MKIIGIDHDAISDREDSTLERMHLKIEALIRISHDTILGQVKRTIRGGIGIGIIIAALLSKPRRRLIREPVFNVLLEAGARGNVVEVLHISLEKERLNI